MQAFIKGIMLGGTFPGIISSGSRAELFFKHFRRVIEREEEERDTLHEDRIDADGENKRRPTCP